MSQHIYDTTHEQRPVCVTIGYDRPLDCVFMIVLRADAPDDEDEIVYSNLDDSEAGTDYHDVNYFRRVLQTLGITVPESVFAETLRDQAQRAGNRLVNHNPEAR